jgi:hypothetical protein
LQTAERLPQFVEFWSEVVAQLAGGATDVVARLT